MEIFVEPDASTQTNVELDPDVNEPAEVRLQDLEDPTQEPARKK